PHLITCETHFGEYKRYSRRVHTIYERFTDRIESCSIDECALDVTESVRLFGSGGEIAERIRRVVKEELRLTVSVGVSFNKVFAKLASEMKKPDAVTVISRENYREKVFPLPVTDLLLVGKATAETLRSRGIRTIGELAVADRALLVRLRQARRAAERICRGGRRSRPIGRGEGEQNPSEIP
ncbi:MAG: DNA polymerase IV, partial [Christensenellaceae bacterium]